MPKEIKNKKPISLPEAMEKLLIREEQADPSYLQRVSMEHAMSFSRVIPLAARYLVHKLMTDFNLEERVALTIVNVFPTILEELELLLQTLKVNLATETVKQILQTIEPYRDSPESYVRELIMNEGANPDDFSETSVVQDLHQTKSDYQFRLMQEAEEFPDEDEILGDVEEFEDTFDAFAAAQKKKKDLGPDPYSDVFS